MNIVSINQMAVTSTEAIRAGAGGIKAKKSEKAEAKDAKVALKSIVKFDRKTLQAKSKELSTVLNGLSKMGVSHKAASNVIKTANRNINKKIEGVLDHRPHVFNDKFCLRFNLFHLTVFL